MAIVEGICGTGGWTGPLPGDPDNNVYLSANGVFGGIDVSWSYPLTNAYAVIHTLLFRGLTTNLVDAVQIRVVAGNSYYDQVTSTATQYYWIRIVSVNGTIGDAVGPAAAIAKPLFDGLLATLPGKITRDLLEASLASEIARIIPLGNNIAKEIIDRLAENAAIVTFLQQVQTASDSAVAFITKEITARVTADSSLLSVIDLQGVAVNNNAAAIQTETITRANKDLVLATQITTVQGVLSNNIASVSTTANTALTKAGYLEGQYTVKIDLNG